MDFNVDENTALKIREELINLSEEDYRDFSSKLLPGINNMLGVRLPALRKIAKSIAKEDWKNYLDNVRDDYFEEVMLQGMDLPVPSMPSKTIRRPFLSPVKLMTQTYNV